MGRLATSVWSPSALGSREGQGNGCPEPVRFQLPTGDWREEHEWERREADNELSAPAGPSTGSPSVLEERGQIGKAGRPPPGQNWWRRLLARLRGWNEPSACTPDGEDGPLGEGNAFCGACLF